jgi:hypothetical protein
LTKVAREAASSSLPDAVTVAAPDSTAYDVTINAIAGSGVLRLDVRDNNTGITDMAANAPGGGFASGQTYTVYTSQSRGFNSFQELDPVSISSATREIPQAKVWNHAGKWWAVLATPGGTKVLRLDNTNWTDVLTIASATNARADCRVVGNLVHILLVRGASSASYFVSLEYDAASHIYKRWTQRTSNVNIVFEAGTITATLANDATGRMWIASSSNGNMLARWSDSPYSTWSSPVTIASGAINEDICAVTTLPGKIALFWTDQTARRFGFKTHADGADPTVWSADEAPAAQSALDAGDGIADDHLNVVAASDGTLYAAVKTGYDRPGLPTIALLVRRPNGTWDGVYPVASSKEGNRPIVILNEAAGKVKVVYCTHLDNFDGTRSGDILYRESSTSAIAFGPPVTLLSGKGTYSLEYITSTHQVYDSSIVILATNETVSPYQAVGVLATDMVSPEILTRHATTQPLAGDIVKIDKLLVRPNPFGASTTIDFILAHSGRYSVILYDSKGTRGRVIKQGWAEAGGGNMLTIDGTQLNNGSYYVKIQTEYQTRTLRLLKR